jgi:septum site-determining protein MinC
MAQAKTSRAEGRGAKSGQSFELKSATLGLLALMLKSADLSVLAIDLQARLGETPTLFNFDPLLIDLTQLRRDDPEMPVDLMALMTLLRRHRMQPVALLGANAAELALAQSLGLADAPVDSLAVAKQEPAPREVVREVVHEVVREVAVPGEAVKTLIIDKPLRSGQQVYAKGGDLVVLALVSNGAEVIADGHIHVYAPLRGKAIAGAKGDTTARIFATSMEAELIAIAGTYRTTENPLPDSVFGKPAQIRLDGEKLVMEALKF